METYHNNGFASYQLNDHDSPALGHEANDGLQQNNLLMKEVLQGEEQKAPTAKMESPEAESKAKALTKRVTKAQAGSADLKAVKEKKKPARYRETGHSINVQHFAMLKQIIIGFGSDYVSPNPLYALSNLELLYTTANASVETVTNKLSLYQQDIDAQTVAFSKLKKDATRTKNVFAICGAPVEAVKRCESINSLIQGERIIKLKTTDNKDHVSASHQSHTNQIKHVDSLIELLSAYPEYVAPADLTVAAWTTRRDAMYNTLQAVTVTSVDLKMARLDRNITIYAPINGLVEVAYGVKKVVLGFFGARSPQYRMVSGIEFKRIKDYKNL
ncbi:MAG: hypothetical protein R2797_04920 [Gelidibacter sp.]